MNKLKASIIAVGLSLGMAFSTAPAASATTSSTTNSVFVTYQNAHGSTSIKTNGVWKNVAKGQTTPANTLSSAVNVASGCRVDISVYYGGKGSPGRITLYDRPSTRYIFNPNNYYRVTTVC